LRIHPVAKRYARAIFELAAEQNKLDTVFDQLKAFAEVMQKDTRLRYYFLSPQVGKQEKSASLDALLHNKVDKIVSNTLLLLIKNNRLESIEQIVFFLNRFNDRKHNRIQAVVTSAIALTEQNLQKLQTLLSESFHAQIILENVVKPDILGGFIIQVEGKIIDGSIIHQLNTMKQELMQTKVYAA